MKFGLFFRKEEFYHESKIISKAYVRKVQGNQKKRKNQNYL